MHFYYLNILELLTEYIVLQFFSEAVGFVLDKCVLFLCSTAPSYIPRRFQCPGTFKILPLSKHIIHHLIVIDSDLFVGMYLAKAHNTGISCCGH